MQGSTLILDAFWVDKKPFPTMQLPETDDGKAFYEHYSGSARYIGWMDIVILKSLVKNHNINHIILQNLGTLGKIVKIIKELKVCVAYEYRHTLINTIPKKKTLVHCSPIYTTIEFGGWDFSDNDHSLPGRAELYIGYLLTHTRVDSITCMNNKIKVTAHWDKLGNIVFDTEPNL